MRNGLFKLYSNDYVKGLMTAVFAAILTVLYSVVMVDKFDLFSVDWSTVLHNVVNASVVSFFAYLMKNFLSTNEGSVLNVTPEDKPLG